LRGFNDVSAIESVRVAADAVVAFVAAAVYGIAEVSAAGFVSVAPCSNEHMMAKVSGQGIKQGKPTTRASVNVRYRPSRLDPFHFCFGIRRATTIDSDSQPLARSDRANAATFVPKAHIAITHWCERARYPRELRFGNSVELADK
jgi:hypothetical protein